MLDVTCSITSAATSRPSTIDGSMRRAGRLDKEICLGIPNERFDFSHVVSCLSCCEFSVML